LSKDIAKKKQDHDFQTNDLSSSFILSPSHRSIVPLLEHKIVRGTKKQRLPPPSSHLHDLVQVKVLKQYNHSSCGYYALFNAVLTLLAICEKRDSEAKDLLSLLTNRTYFWRRFQEMKNLLHHHAEQRNEKWYPWTKKDIDSDILERSYVRYLRKTCPWIKFLNSDSRVGITCMPDFAHNTLKYQVVPLKTMEKLDFIFSKFNENSGDYVHAFVLGQTSHWLTIVVNKVNGRVETLLLDSKNSFVFGLQKEELLELLMNRLRRKQKLDYPQWKIDIAMASFFDTQFTVKILHESAIGNYQIKIKLFDVFVEGFFEIYETAMKEGAGEFLTNNSNHDNNDSARDAFLVGFVNWLENYCPPATIEANLIGFIRNLGVKMTDQQLNKFQAWEDEIRKKIDFENCNIPVLGRFRET